MNRAARTINDRRPNFRQRDGQLVLIRCFNCDPVRGVENHIRAAACGFCATCGWKDETAEETET